MTPKVSQKLWLPYLVGATGIILSILFWYIIEYDPEYIFGVISPGKETFPPWIILVLGIMISALIAALVKTAQLFRQQAYNLYLINESLKKEIAERSETEKTKRRLEVALLQGQKLQAIGTLAGGIAHDFNNILYAIIGYCELAREDVEANTTLHKNLGKILTAGHRGQELISRILAFSRRHQQKFEIIDAKPTIETALELLRPTIPASVTIQFEALSDTRILGNPTQIHQVLINIINNAVDAMDGEGTITIHLSHGSKNDPGFKQLPLGDIRNYCRIEIRDTGRGMDRTILERIFEPFFTTKEVGKGTGLGLAIVHTIIKEHNGMISVQSRLGQGTTFIILLPEQKEPIKE